MIRITIGRGNKAVHVTAEVLTAITTRAVRSRQMHLVFADTVYINDLTTYNADSCHNGGNYSFQEVYDMDTMEVSYHSSSDFNYCNISGCFCNDDCLSHCGAEYKDMPERKFTIKELDEKIQHLKGDKFLKVIINEKDEDNNIVINVYAK